MTSPFPEIDAGGFSRADGTVAFWARVNALVDSDSVVLDFGAGRGLAAEDQNAFRRGLQTLRGKVRKVIGCDVDPIVTENPLLDEAYVLAGPELPVTAGSVDLIVANAVFEHVSDPTPVVQELDRILRPGGWVCARTPNRYGYIALGARLIPNKAHVSALRHLQPRRQAKDVFPTEYRMNSKRALRSLFPEDRFSHHSYGWNGDPSYFGSSPRLRGLVWRVQQLMPSGLAPTLFVFVQKRSTASQPVLSASRGM